MKREDVVKKMAAVKAAVEKNYSGVKAEVELNEWQKGGYHRLYINLIVTGQVNGKTARESSSFGFVNLKTNRYNVGKAYDMRHFDGKLLTAKFISFYADAYKSDDNGQRYTVRPSFTDVLNVRPGQLLSKQEMLDKSWAMNIAPDELSTYWDTVDCVQASEKSIYEVANADGFRVVFAGKKATKHDGIYSYVRMVSDAWPHVVLTYKGHTRFIFESKPEIFSECIDPKDIPADRIAQTAKAFADAKNVMEALKESNPELPPWEEQEDPEWGDR